jgi:hypothetical protein
MPYPDYVELLAAESIEPRGERRADLRAGKICAATMNVWLKKGAAPFKPADFMPDFAKRAGSDRKSLSARLRAYTAAAGGEVRDVKG